MKVAFVYDRVNKIGGAEQILTALHEIWPQAPLYTAVYDSTNAPWSGNFKVIPSFLQSIPMAAKAHEYCPFLTPQAFESFSFANFDMVISVTSAEAKFVITNPGTLHICYCLTPTRYLWSGYNDYLENPGFNSLNFVARLIFWATAPLLRTIDSSASWRPDYYIAISNTVNDRIKKYYQKRGIVIYPPVDINKIKNQKSKKNKEEYFLVVSRLVPYKKIDLIVKVFNQLGWKLKIIGVGNQLSSLKKIAQSNINFLGQVNDKDLIYYYQDCQALVMAAEEDFGISLVEAQAAGKPVIAFGRGGAQEIIKDSQTGILFARQMVKDLKLAMHRFKQLKFKPLICQQNAQRFSKENFKNRFRKFVEEKWQLIQQSKLGQ